MEKKTVYACVDDTLLRTLEDKKINVSNYEGMTGRQEGGTYNEGRVF